MKLRGKPLGYTIYMKTTILVTGCAGFIGSNFVRQFKAQFPDATIIGIDNFATGRKSEVDPSITFYEGSIADADLVEKIFTKHSPEFIFHFAALPRVSYSVEEPVKTSETNILGTLTLLQAAKNHKAKRFIFSSSSSVYGGAANLPTAEADNIPNPKSPYALQKYASEHACRIFSDLHGLDTVVLRYFNVFGPGQYGDSPYATVIAAWLESIYSPQKKQLFLEGDGKQSRDFSYVDNVVDANILAMQSEKKFKGDIFNIANGERIDLLQTKELIEKYTGTKLNLENRPERLGDVKHSHADIAKARKILGFSPRISFAEGLKRTIAWNQKRFGK